MSTLQATQKPVTSDSTIPVVNESITDEKCTSFEPMPSATGNVTLKKEISQESVAILKPLSTGHSVDFKDEVLMLCFIDFSSAETLTSSLFGSKASREFELIKRN